MKRFAVALMMVFMTMFVFSTPLDIEEDSNVYWEFEKDVNGQLITYYMFKTDRQFYGNLEFFIKENMNGDIPAWNLEFSIWAHIFLHGIWSFPYFIQENLGTYKNMGNTFLE